MTDTFFLENSNDDNSNQELINQYLNQVEYDCFNNNQEPEIKNLDKNIDLKKPKIISLDLDETLISGSLLYLINKSYIYHTKNNIPIDIVSNHYFAKGGARIGTRQLLQTIYRLLKEKRIDQCILFTSASNKKGYIDYICNCLEHFANIPYNTISRKICREHQYGVASDGATIKDFEMIPSFFPNIGSLNKKIIQLIFELDNLPNDLQEICIRPLKEYKDNTEIKFKISELEDLNLSKDKLSKIRLYIDDEIVLIDNLTKEEKIFVNGDGNFFDLKNIVHVDDRPFNIIPDTLLNTNIFAVQPYYYYLNITKDAIELINHLPGWNQEVFNRVTKNNTLLPNKFEFNRFDLKTVTGDILEIISYDYINYGKFQDNKKDIQDNIFNEKLIPFLENFF